MANTWNTGINDRKIKEQICEIGRRVYAKGFAAANDGNISYRVGDNEVLCSPTMICKGFMTPDDLCAVGGRARRGRGSRARRDELVRSPECPVPDRELVAGVEQTARHAAPHCAQSEHGYV